MGQWANLSVTSTVPLGTFIQSICYILFNGIKIKVVFLSRWILWLFKPDSFYFLSDTTRNNQHYCELCKELLTTQELLISHYRDHHKVTDFAANLNTADNLPNLDLSSDNGHMPSLIQSETLSAEVEPVEENHSASQIEEPTVTQSIGKSKRNDEAVNSKKAQVTRRRGRALSRQRARHQSMNGGAALNTNTNEDEDFNFILVTDMVKGPSFSYGKTSFKCLHCDYKAVYKNALKRHMNERHKDMFGMNQEQEIPESENVNGRQQKVIKMSAYNTQMTRTKVLRKPKRPRPVEKQDMPGVFTCQQCSKVFNRLRYLKKHVETHRLEKKFLCDECGKSFKSRTYLSVHRKVHQVEGKLFKCAQCDFTSRINAAIHAHRQLHSQGSVLCDICGYAYTDKSTLNKHKRVHDLTRPYACTFPQCTWRFKTETMCKAHIRAHTTEGKFRCRDCGYVFRQKHHLLRHETNMHGIQHIKSRSSATSIITQPMESADMRLLRVSDTVNLVINSPEIDADHLQLHDHHQQMVVTTDQNGTPITYETTPTDQNGTSIAYETTDLAAFNVAMQTLMQQPDSTTSSNVSVADNQTVLISHQEPGHLMQTPQTACAQVRTESNHIIFKQD